MNPILCWIKKGHPDWPESRFTPYIMETYPDEGDFQRRDFFCRNEEEAIRIAQAVYGAENVRIEIE